MNHENEIETLSRKMQSLLDRVSNEHSRDAGKSDITSTGMSCMRSFVDRSRGELGEIRSFAEDLIKRGIGKEWVIRDNLQIIEDAISDYERSVTRVYRANSYASPPAVYRRVSVHQYRPINDHLCQLARSIMGKNPYREYVGTTEVIRRIR
jgi:hypothetical protein